MCTYWSCWTGRKYNRVQKFEVGHQHKPKFWRGSLKRTSGSCRFRNNTMHQQCGVECDTARIRSRRHGSRYSNTHLSFCAGVHIYINPSLQHAKIHHYLKSSTNPSLYLFSSHIPAYSKTSRRTYTCISSLCSTRSAHSLPASAIFFPY